MVYSPTPPLRQARTPSKRISSNIEIVKRPAQDKKQKRSKTRPVTLRVKCSHCETMFEAERKTAKYCSTKCRVAHHRQAKRDAKKHNGKQCVRCCKPLVNRQRLYCGSTCKELVYRQRRQSAIEAYHQIGIPLDTVLESFEMTGFSKASHALQAMGYTYSYDRKEWIGELVQ